MYCVSVVTLYILLIFILVYISVINAYSFIHRYDVDRSEQIADSEVQVIDGFFVHYFVPEAQKVLPKHIIFVLDTR